MRILIIVALSIAIAVGSSYLYGKWEGWRDKQRQAEQWRDKPPKLEFIE